MEIEEADRWARALRPHYPRVAVLSVGGSGWPGSNRDMRKLVVTTLAGAPMEILDPRQAREVLLKVAAGTRARKDTFYLSGASAARWAVALRTCYPEVTVHRMAACSFGSPGLVPAGAYTLQIRRSPTVTFDVYTPEQAQYALESAANPIQDHFPSLDTLLQVWRSAEVVLGEAEAAVRAAPVDRMHPTGEAPPLANLIRALDKASHAARAASLAYLGALGGPRA